MRYIVSFITLLLTLLPARAELTASLLTIDPGRDIYELEGHTELRLTDPEQGIDMCVSWGVFDFNSPGFITRFVAGETDYLTIGYPYEYFLYRNGLDGRRVTAQRLNLTPDEGQRLLDLALENIKPENRVYRYNYVKDNCATRPVMLLEKAIGAPLSNPGDTITSTTWRTEMTRYHRNYPWYQFGIDLALGSGIDRPITGREMCYAPYALRSFMAGAHRPDGTPIVADETVVMEGTPDGQPASPTPWFLTPMAAALLLLAVTIATAWRDTRRGKVSRWLFTLLYGMAFIAGLILTYLIFVSTHEATSPNWLYLWLNPLSIVGAAGVWLKKPKRMVYFYQIVNFAALTALIVTGLTGVQHLNMAFYPLIVCYMITAGEYIYLYRRQQDKCHTKSTSPSKDA